jgi:hypothetical protein
MLAAWEIHLNASLEDRTWRGHTHEYRHLLRWAWLVLVLCVVAFVTVYFFFSHQAPPIVVPQQRHGHVLPERVYFGDSHRGSHPTTQLGLQTTGRDPHPLEVPKSNSTAEMSSWRQQQGACGPRCTGTQQSCSSGACKAVLTNIGDQSGKGAKLGVKEGMEAEIAALHLLLAAMEKRVRQASPGK